MQSPAPIRAPLSRIWREVRVRQIPMVLFVILTALAGVLWSGFLGGPRLAAHEPSRCESVSSPKPGVISQLNATPRQRVKAGEVIGQVLPNDPLVVESSLGVIYAQINLLRLGLEPLHPTRRTSFHQDSRRLDRLESRVQHLRSRLKLDLATANLCRMERLYATNAVNDELLAAARTVKEQLTLELDASSLLLLEQAENPLRSVANEQASFQGETDLTASIRLQEDKLRLAEAELRPVQLRVPVDGTISAIYRHTGDAVIAGEAIATVTALHPDPILSLNPPRLDRTAAARRGHQALITVPNAPKLLRQIDETRGFSE